MTIEEALARLAKIEAESVDDESAHCEEDEFHRDVLAHIAESSSDPEASLLARLALKTLEIEFSRWYA